MILREFLPPPAFRPAGGVDVRWLFHKTDASAAVGAGGCQATFSRSRVMMRRVFTAWVFIILTSPVLGQSILAEERHLVPVFRIRGEVPEAPDALGLAELLGEKAPTNMFDLLAKLRQARTDERVKAVVFDIEEARLGFAQIQELRGQFEALRAAEKDVWIFAESIGPGGLMLASAASKLVLLPTGDANLSGFYTEGLYFKKLLDKIGVQADIMHSGPYKAAGEPFTREGPSKEAEEQLNWLLDSLFKQMIEQIAKSRRLTPEKVRKLIDVGRFSPKEALEAKLVDQLMYREEFIKKLRRTYGAETRFVTDYGRKKGPELDLDNPFAVFKLFGDMVRGAKESDKPAIAVVYVEGPITTGDSEPGMFGGRPENAGSATVRKAIAEAARDDNVKALILRVDSPGGSAIGSDVICEAAKQFKKSGRPFIVSMGNVAGSGGYYVSALGDVIFAEPATITGSIGVVYGKFVTRGLWDWMGVTQHEFKRGKHADLMNANRPFNDEERKLVTAEMNRIYEDFKNRVLEGRKDRIKGELEPLAGGRVYTGAQALEIGLVDRLGGFADAVKYAASEAELGSDFELRVFPKPKSIMDLFAEAFGGKKSDDRFLALPAAGSLVGSSYRRLPVFVEALEIMRRIDPAKARALRDFGIHLELLSRENVLLIGPPIRTVGP